MPLHQTLAQGPHRSFVPPRTRRWSWGVVLGLHAAALWWASVPPAQPPVAQPASVVLWWQAPPTLATLPAERPTPNTAQAAKPTPPSTPAERLRTVPVTQTPVSPTEALPATRVDTGLPSGADLARGAEASGTAVTPAPAASAASAPLKLDLPRLTPRGPREASLGAALNDARSNSPVKTMESRIAAAMGDGRWTMEDLGEGRKRYRRGAQCIETRPARSNQIDPFNAGFRNAPDLVGGC